MKWAALVLAVLCGSCAKVKPEPTPEGWPCIYDATDNSVTCGAAADRKEP